LETLNLSGNHLTGNVLDLSQSFGLETCQLQKNDFDFVATSGPPAPANNSAVTNMLNSGIRVTWFPQNAPSITANPQDESVDNGSSDPFSVTVEGAPPMYYQWQSNGTNLADNSRISGSLTTNLTINPVQFSDGGPYQVIITNAYGSVTSNPAMLTVTTNGIAPQISNQPINQSVATGGNAAFSVSATGSTPFSYQWFFNGTSLPGATTATVVITGASLSNAGPYTVIVSNPFGVSTNLVGTLSVANVPLSFAANGAGIQYSDGLVVLQVSGLTGSGAAEVQVSSNLVQWTPLSTNSVSSGTIQIIDTTGTSTPTRYYRVVVSP
jgi:hypothetical protein